jgi:hypothetical protein
MLNAMHSIGRTGLGAPFRVGIGVVGVATFAAGLVAVFKTNNGTGSAALVTVGAVLALFAALGDRVQALGLGSAKLSLRDLARQRFALASEREVAGDAAAATELRHQGLALQRLANEYASIRRRMRGGNRRTAILDHLMDQLARLAQEHPFAPGDVWEWFSRGQAEARITAIGVMRGDPQIRDVFVVLNAIEDSHSAFEQYHALRLAKEMLPNLSVLEREWLREVIERAQRRRSMREDGSRRRVSEAILSDLAGSSNASGPHNPTAQPRDSADAARQP